MEIERQMTIIDAPCTKIGDSITLYRGDYELLESLDLQATALIADPPFGITESAKKGGWDEKINHQRLWEVTEKCCIPNCTVALFGVSGFLIDLINSKRDWYRYQIQWVKNRKCGFLNSRFAPLRQHETIAVFSRPGFARKATYNAQRTPGGRIGTRKITRKCDSIYGGINDCVTTSDGWQHPTDVVYCELDRHLYQRAHPCQKPVALMTYLVRTFTNEGDLVIDPFMGSGTTAEACLLTGRRFVGTEKNADFYETAVERLQRAYETPKQNPLFDLEAA